MVNAKESDDEDEDDPVSRKFKKKKKKGKADSVKKLNMKNPWNVDSESRYTVLLLILKYIQQSLCNLASIYYQNNNQNMIFYFYLVYANVTTIMCAYIFDMFIIYIIYNVPCICVCILESHVNLIKTHTLDLK